MFGRFAGISLSRWPDWLRHNCFPSVALAQYYDDDQDYRPPQWDRRQDQDWGRPPRDWDRGGCSRRDLVAAARDEGFRRIDSIK